MPPDGPAALILYDVFDDAMSAEWASEITSDELRGASALRSAEAATKAMMSEGRESKPQEGIMMDLFL